LNLFFYKQIIASYFFFFIKASHPNAEVHLHCGPREKIGIPSTIISVPSPQISASYNHGWSRLAYNNPPNPTSLVNDRMMGMRLFVTTSSHSFLDANYSKYRENLLKMIFLFL